MFRPVSCARRPPDSRRCLLLEHVHAHVDHLLRALLERELGALRPSTLSCRCRRDLRAIALDAHNGWVGPAAADRRAPSHPGQHGHIALFTAKALLSQSVVEKESAPSLPIACRRKLI